MEVPTSEGFAEKDTKAVIDTYIKQIRENARKGYAVIQLRSPRGDVTPSSYDAFYVDKKKLIRFLEEAKEFQ